MSVIRSYRDLRAWQRAMDLVVVVYELLRQLPADERFGLRDQVRRCAVSIPCNLAEGHARGSRGDFVRFIRISLGSLAELETQLEVIRRMQMVDLTQVNTAVGLAADVGRKLTKLRLALKRSSPVGPSPQSPAASPSS